MFTRRLLTGVALIATAAAFAAPHSFADQKPDASRTRYMDAWTAGDLTEPPGSTGWGRGSVVLPVGEQLGLMVGVLVDGGQADRYMIEGELTGCMPSNGTSGSAQYWFGGLYGRMQKVVDTPPDPDRDDVPWFAVEGMWFLDKHYGGTFTAELFGRNEAGTWYVCGVVSGHFEVSEAMPGPAPAPDQALGLAFFDGRRPFDKSKLAGTPFGDRATGTITCPKADELRDALGPKPATAPCSKSFDDRRPFDKSKLAGTPFGDRATATIRCPKADDGVDVATPPKAAVPPPGDPIGYITTFGDSAELYRKKFGGVYEQLPCTAGWRDVRSTVPPFATPTTPSWPVLTGTFDLRYQLYE